MSPFDPAVFERADIRAALAHRDIGAVYRIIVDHGLSQRRLAELVGQTQSEVSEILKGRQARSNAPVQDSYGLRPVKVSEMLKLLASDGWVLKNVEGSHRQFVHPTKPGKVTVAGKPSITIPRGTEASILRQAGLKRNTAEDETQKKEG